jgi:histidinol phosphatase-like enzyme (inositol monophosphatase family)
MSEPSASDLQDLLDVALRAAGVARTVIMPLYESGIEVDLKADSTPVTAADRGAELAIRDFLARECPGHGVLGEEFPETPADGPYRWVLDPIDGTKSFIHHVPLFGSLIALEHAGVPVVGVIACHAAGETVAAARGLGCRLNGEPCHVSDTALLADSTLLTTSYSRLLRLHPKAFESLVYGCGLARAWGDCHGYLAVAAGRADIMLDPEMNPWDVAALYPVITEAGGTITTWDGSAKPGDSCVATNGRLHPIVMDALRLDAPAESPPVQRE